MGRNGFADKAIAYYAEAREKLGKIDLTKEALVQLTQIYVAQGNVIKVRLCIALHSFFLSFEIRSPECFHFSHL
jgi:hypothetical protein